MGKYKNRVTLQESKIINNTIEQMKEKLGGIQKKTIHLTFEVINEHKLRTLKSFDGHFNSNLV